MTKHIMLMFLSDVKARQEDSKVVVSTATYPIGGRDVVTKTTNESAIRYLLADTWQGKPIDRIDRIFMFASHKVRKEFVGVKRPKQDLIPLLVNGKPISHLDYFKEQLKDVMPNATECVDEQSIYPYEESEPIEKAMGMVADVAGRIRAYAREFPDDEIILHADCTGGLRHANMMMLSVMRLMQYQRIRIGRVLYSNFDINTHRGTVEVADEIYHLFDLIAGAEEFARFGSVSAIRNYFAGRTQPPELKKLLDAMEHFANEVKLCHRGRFQAAVNKLRAALLQFEAAMQDQAEEKVGEPLDAGRLNNKWMYQLQERIQKDYGLLLNPSATDLDSIQWCLDHGYLQQAMTLYTECLPEILCREPDSLVYVDDEQHRQAAQYQEEGDRRSFNFFLLNIYEIKWAEAHDQKDLETKDAALDRLQGSYKMKITKLLGKGSYDMTAASARLEEILDEMPEVWLLERQAVMDRLRRIRDLHDNPSPLMQPVEEGDSCLQLLLKAYSENQQKKGLPLWETDDAGERFKVLLKFLKSDIQKKPAMEVFGRLSVNYSVRFLHLLTEALVSTRLSKQQIISVMNRYAQIKAERNTTNHAKLEESRFRNSEELRRYMEDGVKELAEILASHEGEVSES